MVGEGGNKASVPLLSSTWKMETITGSHDLKIDGYSLIKKLGIGKCISSDAFVVGGYSWKMRFYPNGYDKKDKGFVSVYLALVSDATTGVRARFDLTLFNQGEEWKNVVERFEEFGLFHPLGKPTVGIWGWSQFLERTKLDGHGFLKHDCLHFGMRVEVLQSHANDSIPLPPPNMNQHFGNLLESGEGVDVKFEVEGQTFSAHKLVLAARSSVFKAQFFGQMKDRRARCIAIEDMEAPIFKALLHFIYWDHLPNLEVVEVESEHTFIMICEHLFAAADRYDLERLRLLCAAKLCDNMTIDTIATTLRLAEQHNCLALKLACLKFLTRSGLHDAMERDDFKYIKETSPNLYIDILEYISGINKLNIPAYNQGTKGTEGVVNESSDGNKLKRRKI